MSRIVQEFYRSCEANCDRTAVYYLRNNRRESRTFAELRKDVATMVSLLRQHGVQPGDRILTFTSSGYTLCLFMLATLCMGVSVMYVDIYAKQESLQQIFQKTRPHHILVSDRTRLARYAFPAFRQIRSAINIDSLYREIPKEEYVPEEIGEDAAGLITVTTGSTGTPKLFLRSHGDLFEQLQLTTRNNEAKKDEDIVLTTSYIYIFSNLIQGMTTAIPNVNLGRKNTEKIIRKLEMFRDLPITRIMTSPDFCLRTPNMYPSLELMYFGGAILNLHEAEIIKGKYPDCRIIYIYGSTECNLIAMNTLDEYIRDLKKDGVCSLGKVCDGVSVRIDDDGHILVKSDALLTKSFEDISLQDGYYDTHDVGMLKDGRLLYRGKHGFYVPVESRQLCANEIEQQVILQFPEIPKCAIVYQNGETVLFYEKCSTEPDEIRRFLQDQCRLDAKVVCLDPIPKDIKHHTKINYLKLKKLVEKEQKRGCQ